MRGDNPDAPSFRSIVSKEHEPEIHLHPLDRVKGVPKLEEVFLSDLLPTADDLHK